MANKEEKDEVKTIEVPESLLVKMQEDMAKMEQKIADQEAKSAGLEEIVAKSAETNGDLKLKEKKDFEPKFRSIRIRKYPMFGDELNLGYVIAWTNKGAYQDAEMTPMGKVLSDYIDVIYLGNEKKDGKIQAEKIKLLDFLNKGQQVHCKILETTRNEKKVATGEEIDVSIFDPAHGLISTGDKIDGYYAYSEIKYKIQIPGVAEPIWIDALYANA